MAKFADIVAKNEKFRCEKCGKVIIASEWLLKPAATNIVIYTPIMPFIFIDRDGVIRMGGTNAEEGDQVLTCPICGKHHPWGLTKVKESKMSSEEMVTITKKEYEKLKEDSKWLGCLNAAGVDNWDGIDYAQEIAEEGD